MKPTSALRTLLACCLVLLPPAQGARAQTTAYLSDEEVLMLSNELSGDRSFEHVRWLTHWHRDSGMEGYFKAAEYVQQAAKEVGLEDVRFVEQPAEDENYTARSAELWMVEPVEVKLADIGEHNVYLADRSHDADLTADLVWVGDASDDALKDLDVSGKIVLTSGSAGRAAQNAVWARGAAGVVSFAPSESKNPLDYPDQIAWTRIPSTPEGKKDTFAFSISPRKGEMLRRVLETEGEQDVFATGRRTPGGRVRLRAKVDTEFTPGRTGYVEGVIRGTAHHDQAIVLTAHLQEEKGSANDDGSGCGNLLEIARTLNKLIKEGRIQRPLRDIKFWWTDEIYSEYRHFQDHPEDARRILANLHQDMTGANQALGSRVQHLILAPHSRTSYLDALFESVGTYVIQTNNGFLAASRQGGLPRPHTRPLYSSLGTRQGYNARFVPWFGSSDHLVFLEGAVGIPAVALINWDDDFIHSSDDDLDQIDPTQLKRNAFLVAAMAFFLAYATPDDVPVIAGETYAQGAARLATDLRVAVRLLREGASDPADSWKRANYLVEQGVLREARALESARVFAAGNARAGQTIDELTRRMRARASELQSELATHYRQLHGAAPRLPSLNADEQAAQRKVPANVASLADYFANRNRARPQGLMIHGLMRDEVFNFVDGRRSYYDIYKAVYAESQAAGTWYYGTVRLADVVKLLDAAVESKALTLK